MYFNLVVLGDTNHSHIKIIQSPQLHFLSRYPVTQKINNCFPLWGKKTPLKYTHHLLMLHLAFQESRPSWNRNAKRMDLCLHYRLAEWCKCLLSNMLPLVCQREPVSYPHTQTFMQAISQRRAHFAVLSSNTHTHGRDRHLLQSVCTCAHTTTPACVVFKNHLVPHLLLMSGWEMGGISSVAFCLHSAPLRPSSITGSQAETLLCG